MRYLIPLLLLLTACAKSGGGGSVSNSAPVVKAVPNNASDLSGTYSLAYLSCDQGISPYSSTVGDDSYSDVITISGSDMSETETNSSCSGTYGGSLALNKDGVSLSSFAVSSATNGISCNVAKQNMGLITFDNMAVGSSFGGGYSASYILGSTTLSIQNPRAQRYGDTSQWTNCWDVYQIQ